MKKEKTPTKQLKEEEKEDKKEDAMVKDLVEVEKKVIKVEGADVLEEVPEEEELEKKIPEKTFDMSSWKPKTSIGLKVKSSEIKEIDEILDAGLKIMEPEIVDVLLPNLNIDLLSSFTPVISDKALITQTVEAEEEPNPNLELNSD